MGVKNLVRRVLLKRSWRKQNKHNDTTLESQVDIHALSVGNYSYGPLQVLLSNDCNQLRIGNFCSIAADVVFIPGSDHSVNRISTFPFKVQCLRQTQGEAISKGDIVVEDDVWIGHGATILSGVHIRQGAVVAAGAVVSKDVPPYAIVGGVPAKVIKYRFAPPIIEELLKVDYGKLTKEMVEMHIDKLYEELTDVSQLDWMPKKMK